MCITRSNVRKFFRIDGEIFNEMEWETTPKNPNGRLFRFEDVVLLAKRHFGESEAQRKAAKAKVRMGITKMEGVLIHDL